MRTTARLGGALLAAVLPLTACGGQDELNPLQDGDDEIVGGAVGPDETVNETLEVLQVQLEYPLDGVYEEGEDAGLFFAISNTGTEPATLVDVVGEDFAEATSADGEEISIVVPADDNVYVGAEDVPAVVLQDLETSLRSSQSIPVTFVFGEAEELTIEAMVSASGQNPTPTVDVEDPDEDPNDS